MSENGAAGGHVIVLGNEKGGTGKSTTAMHLAVALMRDGHDVGTIDLDSHQGTFSRYVENRKTFSESKGVRLPLPDHRRFRYPANGTVSETLTNLDQMADQCRPLFA